MIYRCAFVLSAIAVHKGQAIAEINGANKQTCEHNVVQRLLFDILPMATSKPIWSLLSPSWDE